mgnify:CR=1 FL=1
MTDIDLKGRLALVSGASRGIGRALALELARAGAHVIATARTQGALEELDDAIKATGLCAAAPELFTEELAEKAPEMGMVGA